MTGFEILAGLLTAEALHKINQQFGESDEQINRILNSKELEDEEIKQAIKILAQDESKLDKLYNTIDSILLNRKDVEDKERKRALDPIQKRISNNTL